MRPTADRLRAIIDLVVASAEEQTDPAILAARAHLSRFYFDRLFKAAVHEAPGLFRRRLLLERAAYRLQTSGDPLIEVALDSGFGSPEAFGRAFRRAFGHTPSAHRRRHGTSGHRLDAPNGIHFHPPAGLLIEPSHESGRTAMDLTDRLLDHDLWLSMRILEAAASLDDRQLDEPVARDHPRTVYESREPTIRGMLDRLIFTKETWTASMTGRPEPAAGETSLAGLRLRLERSGREFIALVRRVRDRREWDQAFVDALCDPPETFTYGGAVAHVLTYGAYRRQQLLQALSTFGIDGLGIGDPIEWERAVNA